MKKNIMKGMLLACMLLTGIIVQAQTSSNPVGKWDYLVPDAPIEYSKGKAEFLMQDGKLMMVMIADGQSGNPVEVTKTDDTYTCRISSDYFTMTITLRPDGDNLKGVIGVDQWDLDIIMTPEKQ